MDALYYINDRAKYPPQVKLRELLVNEGLTDTGNLAFEASSQSVQGIQMAVILVATVPIILLYPFLRLLHSWDDDWIDQRVILKTTNRAKDIPCSRPDGSLY